MSSDGIKRQPKQHEQEEPVQEPVAGEAPRPKNHRRRTMLIAAGTGVAGLAIGKFFGPRLTLFEDDIELSNVSKKEFKNFRVLEDRDELRLFDRNGNEIFIVDKESFRQPQQPAEN